MTFINQILWVIYPYLCLGSFVFGTLIRFTRNKGSVTAKSSELLEKKQLMIGSILFHIGILLVLAGHVTGILVPKSVTEYFGISNEMYHAFALMMGGFAGFITLIGIGILTFRRFTNARVFLSSSWSDLLIMIALCITITFGLMSSFIAGPMVPTYDYRDTLAVWARQLFYFSPDYRLMMGAPLLFKIHVICGLTIFGVFPYTRLVHALTIPLQYFQRRFIVYRRNRRLVD
ncbi:respiratory nitrate reductase subunit gamma [Enterococcus canis]|uniref:respiratory nitrate reductase subunit gamma n=1 Tax=Enterococcus canis TaxID=214095 RepID=UPI000834C2A7|nr:respiratory nitrate reductase subunit gamma [Enterococcus canis]